MIKICKDKKLNVFNADVCNLPFEENVFDAVICIAVIHHLSTHEKPVYDIASVKGLGKPLTRWGILGCVGPLAWALATSQ